MQAPGTDPHHNFSTLNCIVAGALLAIRSEDCFCIAEQAVVLWMYVDVRYMLIVAPASTLARNRCAAQVMTYGLAILLRQAM
jgi:hypothetical protein